MNRFVVFLLLILLSGFSSIAQIQQELFPDKKGAELINLIVNEYKPSFTLSYNNARDELWGAVAAHNKDSLKCVYTGNTIYINPSASNPRTEAYNKGINCEHSWPQSLGAEGQAKSDMHHLFPTREDVNSGRGNLAFRDIDDIQTDKWYWLNQQKTSIPATNINKYSELDYNKWFEVREDHKGNAARAMVYFYSMYKNLADAKDPNFFNIQIETLYQWHYQDFVDADEEWRNNFIASKQGGNPNPFILDSTLIRRAYFPNYIGWSGVGIIDNSNTFHAFMNHSTKSVEIFFENELEDVQLSIYNLFGQQVKTYHFEKLNKKTSISIADLKTEMYIIQLKGDTFSLYQKVYISN